MADEETVLGKGEPEAEPAAASDPASTEEKNWLETLGASKDYADHPSLKSINSIDGLAKSYIHSQQMVGKDKVVLPTNNSSDEEWGEFWGRVGLPKAEDYEISTEDENVSDDYLQAFATAAHKHNILPKQANALFGELAEYEKQIGESSTNEMNEIMEKEIAGLRREWGSSYDNRVDRAQAALKEYGGQELIDHFNETGMGNSVQMIKHFDKLGALYLEEDVLTKGNAGGANAYLTPDEATRQYNEHLSNRTGPYLNRMHADHKRTVKEVQKLVGIISSAKG